MPWGPDRFDVNPPRRLEPEDGPEEDEWTCLDCGNETLIRWDNFCTEEMVDNFNMEEQVWEVSLPFDQKEPDYCPHCWHASEGERKGRWK